MEIFDDFIIRTTLAALGVVLAAAPLGCFVVWRKMAYFGEAIAHSAILGAALALMFSMPLTIGVLIVVFLMAIVVSTLAGNSYAVDTLLGVIAHSLLAFGLVMVSFSSGVRIDLTAYLFGDILAVAIADLMFIWVGALAVLLLIKWRWNALLTVTLNPDFAWAVGINPNRERLILMLVLAIVIAVAMKVVGALLIVAILIIPPATVRYFVKTPESMVLMSAAVSALAVLIGLYLAYYFDTPTSPTIVCISAMMFCISNSIIWIRSRC